MSLGPVQLLVVGFDRPDFRGEVLAELERLREGDVVRVVDLLVVHKSADGVVQRLHHSDLTAGETDGAVIGALIGLGATGDAGADARALGGVGFQAGLDKARRERIEAQRASPVPDIVGQLTELKALLDDGVLSPEEFQMAKRKLLDG